MSGTEFVPFRRAMDPADKIYVNPAQIVYVKEYLTDVGGNTKIVFSNGKAEVVVGSLKATIEKLCGEHWSGRGE